MFIHLTFPWSAGSSSPNGTTAFFLCNLFTWFKLSMFTPPKLSVASPVVLANLTSEDDTRCRRTGSENAHRSERDKATLAHSATRYEQRNRLRDMESICWWEVYSRGAGNSQESVFSILKNRIHETAMCSSTWTLIHFILSIAHIRRSIEIFHW